MSVRSSHASLSTYVGAVAALLAACGSIEAEPPVAEAPRDDASAGTPEPVEAGIPCPPSGLSKGPWVMAATGTTARVRFEACRPGVSGDVTIEPEAGGEKRTLGSKETSAEVKQTTVAPFNTEAPPDHAGTWYMHEVSVAGLAPSTCYRYALAADSEVKGRFCTARKLGDPVRFLAIGDTNPGLGDTTSKLVERFLTKRFDFTVHLGDIQYYDSTLETWASWGLRMAPLLRQGALFPSIGNHEYEKPYEYEDYVRRYFGGTGLPGNDTTYRFETGGVHFFVLATEEAIGPGSTQAKWFSDEIARVSAEPGYRFSIVYFHKPFVTCGDTGDNPVARLYYEPLFLQYKVALVLQGHMHAYERFELGGLTYVTAGGGGGAPGKPDENASRPYCGDDRKVSGVWHHAALVEIEGPVLRATVLDTEGHVKDSFEKAVP